MALPNVTLNIQDGGLGIIPQNTSKVALKLGVSSGGAVNTLYTLNGAQAAKDLLVAGPLMEAVLDAMNVGGGPVLAMKVNPSAAGSSTSVSHDGTGTGTLAVSHAPDIKITVKITTAGILGTMKFKFKLGTGDYGAEITSTITSFTYLVPGTVTNLTFAAGTYVLNETYTVDVDGSVTQSGAGPAVTQASSPADFYRPRVKITLGGALGTAKAMLSLDNGANYGAEFTIPGTGVVTKEPTGLVLTFAGTFTAGDFYYFTCSPAGYSTSDVSAAFAVVLADSSEWGHAHIIGPPSSASAAASLFSVVDTQMQSAQTDFRYAFAIIECPSSESDATVKAAFASISSKRVAVGIYNPTMPSVVDGVQYVRNTAWPASSRLSGINEGVKPSYVNDGPLANITAISRDESQSGGFDDFGFMTLRRIIGQRGFYLTRDRVFAPGGSDFGSTTSRRVMDTACKITRDALVPYLNGSVRVDPATGYINDADASAIESNVNRKLEAGLVARGQASASSVQVDRTHNIISDSTLPVTVRVTPLGYAEEITVDIGFINPALAA